MITVRYNKAAACPFSENFIIHVAQTANQVEKKIHGQVEVTMVTESEIRKLNATYRGKDAPTDVLSFPWEDSKTKSPFLGQLYLCYSYIAKQAKRFNVPVQEEFVRMLAHGLLHLVGHDHVSDGEAAKMFKLQEKIVVDSLE